MFGANKKNFGVELCESSHKLLVPSRVESYKKKKKSVLFLFFLIFMFYMAKPHAFFSKNNNK